MTFKPLRLSLGCITALLILASACSDGKPEPLPPGPPPRAELPDFDSKSWYAERVIYHISVRNFQDSDADGMGDIIGIRDRIPYLAESLRVGTLLLDPIQPTSFADRNRAVSDFENVDSEVGTLADVDDLLDAAHAAGLKVIMTLPINHVDHEHAWFQAALENTAGEPGQWFVLDATGETECADIQPAEPNIYGTNRWQERSAQNTFYYHRFATSSPDLNLNHTAARDAVKDAISFWLDKGVDGIYFPYSYAWIEDDDKCQNTAASKSLLTEIKTLFSDADGQVLMTTDQFPRGILQNQPNRTLSYINAGADLVIDVDSTYFLHGIGDETLTPDLILEHLETLLPDDHTPVDSRIVAASGLLERPRASASYGNVDRLFKLMLTIQFSAPPVPQLFYADELGTGQGTETVVDVRDFYLPLMAWTTTEPAYGFSDVEPWIPAPQQASMRNVSTSTLDPGSVLSLTKRLIDLRNGIPALSAGQLIARTAADDRTGSPLADVVAWERSLDGRSVVVIHNLSEEPRNIQVDLSGIAWPAGTPLLDLLSAERELTTFSGPDAPPYRLSINRQSSIFLAPQPVSAQTAE